MSAAKKIFIDGIVQGVGFRPFIYNLAKRFELNGFVYNNSEGVYIEVEGDESKLSKFINAIKDEAPPLALIENIVVEDIEVKGCDSFTITKSEESESKFVLISPDVSTCPDCTAELFDPKDRRFEYPFINCTNCGPRFTIIQDIPYDRPKTTMAKFGQCPACKQEYTDPGNRRFHAQPNACPVCGPSVTLYDRNKSSINIDSPIDETVKLIEEGHIIAIKGLGGYHLACDATNQQAVQTLRDRKRRIDKPFAVMIPDSSFLDKICEYDKEELEFLSSIQRPIVLLKRRNDSPIVKETAPGNNYIGVMLPYTPLHHLLLRKANKPLVMTSGNLSEEPIAFDDDDAYERLSKIADYFLINNREIYVRCDDSVSAKLGDNMTMLRRSRGYVPYPIKLGIDSDKHILATGAHLKNTFCFLRDNYAFISHHIGDLENYATLKSFTDGIEHFKKLFYLTPQVIAYDMHPEYLSTKYAMDSDYKIKIPVQHHHAHIASCMIENNVTDKVIGVAFDGTGFGTDGNIWGGEFLVADLNDFKRLAHFEYIPLPGGETAINEPWRIALANLYHYFGDDVNKINIPLFDEHKFIFGTHINLIRQMMEKKINSPLSSAAGRLFDAVSALCNVRVNVNFEAQAAIEFQMLADENETGNYEYDITNSSPMRIIFKKTFEQIIADINYDIAVSTIAGKFHNTIADVIVNTSKRIKGIEKMNKIVLSGGVFQNVLLMKKVVPKLRAEGFEVLTHLKVPPNDGGISLGQAVIAMNKIINL